MTKKHFPLLAVVLGSLLFLSTHSAFAMSRQTRTVTEETDDGTTVYVEEEDVWYGPGFYYGIWFDNEPDYWYWRNDHRHYPSNRNYYHRDHPIHYHHEDHPHGGGRGGGHR